MSHVIAMISLMVSSATIIFNARHRIYAYWKLTAATWWVAHYLALLTFLLGVTTSYWNACHESYAYWRPAAAEEANNGGMKEAQVQEQGGTVRDHHLSAEGHQVAWFEVTF